MIYFLAFVFLTSDIQYDKSVYDKPYNLSLNTEGQELSPEIDWSGETITFSYSRMDLKYFEKTGKERFHTPPRKDYPDVMNGEQYGSDIFIAHKRNNSWKVQPFEKVNSLLGFETNQHLTYDKKALYFSKIFKDELGIFRESVYLSRYSMVDQKWSEPIFFNSLIENPFYSNGKIFFNDKKSINIATCVGDKLEHLSILPAVNIFSEPLKEVWVHPAEQILLFTKGLDTICIYEIGKIPVPLIIVSNAIIGSPSMDIHGNIYFQCLFSRYDSYLDEWVYNSEIIILPKKK